MQNKKFLILSPSEWKDNAVSNMQISAELSKFNNVIYFETPGGRFPKLSEYKRVIYRLRRVFFGDNKANSGLDPINVSIYSPLSIPNHNFFVFRLINSYLLNFQIKRILKANNYDDYYVWCFSPYWADVLKKLNYKKLIFHCVDGLHTYDKSKTFKEKYNNLVEKSDLIFTPGTKIYNELKSFKEKVYKIGHGVSHQNIKSKSLIYQNVLETLDSSKKNIIYAGTLANWIDYDLLIKSADSLADYNFLIVGYIHALAPKEKVKIFLSKKNVFFMGYKNYEELPNYYKFSSVGIVPYQAKNEHIQYSTPTKFLDYFGFGLPVVSTNFEAAKEMDLCKIANDEDSFINLIRELAEENDGKQKFLSEKRINFAKKFTWEIQVKKMTELIDIS